MKKLIVGLLIVAIVVIGYMMYHKSASTPVVETGTDTMLTTASCEEQGGHVVFGIGPAPECEADETVLGSVQDGDAVAIEGALCCK